MYLILDLTVTNGMWPSCRKTRKVRVQQANQAAASASVIRGAADRACAVIRPSLL